MASVTCTVQVGKNGTLTIPKVAREQLNLRQGDRVEVTLRKPGAGRRRTHPLARIVALAKGGPADGAENHDRYLYGQRSS